MRRTASRFDEPDYENQNGGAATRARRLPGEWADTVPSWCEREIAVLGKRYSGLLDYTDGEVHHGLITRGIFSLAAVTGAERAVLEWMRDNPGTHSVAEIATGAGAEEHATLHMLRHFKRADLVTRVESPDTKDRHFRLSDYATNKLIETEVSNREVLGNYLSGSWHYGRLRVFDFLVMLAMQIFIARWTGVAGFGHVVVISMLAAIIGQASTLGLPSSLAVFLPTYKEEPDRGLFKGAYRHALRITIPMAFLATAVAIAVALLVPMKAEIKWAYVWGFSIIPIWVIWDVAQQPCIALKKWNLAWVPDYFIAPLVWVGSLFLLHYIFRADSPVGVMVCKLVAAFVPMVLQVILAEALVRKQSGDASAEYEVRDWWKKGALLLGTNLTNMIRSSVMVLVANFILGASVAGQFAAVKSTLAPTKIIRAIFKSSAVPEIPAFYKEGRKIHLHFLAHSMTAGVTIGTLLMLPVVIIFGRDFLALYGMTSESTFVVLLIIMASRIVTAMFGYPNSILSLTQFQRVSMWISIISMFTLAGLVVTLVIPVRADKTLGMYMLAAVYFINQVIFMGLSWWVLLRVLVLSTLATVLVLPPNARFLERLCRRRESAISDEIAEARSLGQQVPLVGLVGRQDPVTTPSDGEN